MTVDLVLRLLEERDRWRSAFATAEAERDLYRDALNCKGCTGIGKKPIGLDVRVNISPAGETKIAWHWEPCPDCREAREDCVSPQAAQIEVDEAGMRGGSKIVHVTRYRRRAK